MLGQQAWVEARANNDFALFRPLLEKTYQLKRQQAAAIGYAECPYDALLDDFEPGETTANVARVLAELREAAGAASRRRFATVAGKPTMAILERSYPAERTADVSASRRPRRSASTFSAAGSTSRPIRSARASGPHDCRITTRYDEHHFPGAFFGILHEAGHGIYDQGLRAEHYGLPPGEAVSLGIHESQSRMWENLVGRSRAVLGALLSRRRSKRFPARSATCRSTTFISPSTTCGRR